MRRAIRVSFVMAFVLECMTTLPGWAQSIDEACKQAASEPPLIWYSSQDPAFNSEVLKAFTAKYPDIKTEFFRLPSGALAARYSSERDAGLVAASLISLSDPNFVNAALEKKWLVEFNKRDLPSLDRLADGHFDRGVAMTGINVSGITYNRDIVGSTPLSGWKDLVRPEFKGKIALADPRNVPSFMALFRILSDEYGPDFLKQLAAQDLVIVPSAVPGTQQVAAGEYAIVFPNTLAVTAPVEAKGAPIDFVMPDLTTGVEYTTMLSTGASSPNGAKCLYNFLFTEEGQRAFNGTTSVSAFPDLAGMATLPADYRAPKIAEIGGHTAEILQLLQIN